MAVKVDAYNCHKCHVSHSVDNMVPYCASCFSSAAATQDVEQAQLVDGLREEIKRLRAVIDKSYGYIEEHRHGKAKAVLFEAVAARTTQEKP